MSFQPVVFCARDVARRSPTAGVGKRGLPALWGGVVLCLALTVVPGAAVTLWSDSGATLIHDSGAGRDLLDGTVKRNDSSRDTLYFKFHVNPLSDATTEEYFAAFELYEGEAERLGMGNALKAWAYSAFFHLGESDNSSAVASYLDLHSAKPEPATGRGGSNYELPRRGTERTIVFKVQYVAGGDDLVTVWLNPDLGPGANELYQPETLTTRFNANASFDEIRLRHGGGGSGWIFSDMAVATSFGDFVDTSSSKPVAERPGPGTTGRLFDFQSWQPAQGLPHKSIRTLAQTRDGYLWIGSDDGLTQFDGVRFVTFDERDDWHRDPVQVLFADRGGGLWIGTAEGGLTRLHEGQFTTYTTRAGLPSGSITALTEDRKGRLWVGTETGLAVWRDGRFVRPDGAAGFAGKRITALFPDRQGDLWIGAMGAGVFQFHSGQFIPVLEPSVTGLLQDPHCLLVDQTARLWIGAGDDVVLCRAGEQWRRYRIPRHAGRHYVSALAEDPDGNVWAGSVSEGLFQFKGGKLTAINASSGLSDNLVKSLLVDREGKLWVGTDAGLNRLRHRDIFVFGQEEGLGYGAVLGLAEVASGVIWAAKPADGLYRWEGRAFSRIKAAGLPSHEPRVTALLVARDGSCWVACARGLLRFKDPQAVADESRLMGLTNRTILALAEDFGGQIWAGTREGELWQLGHGTWVEQTNAWRNHAVTAIVPAKDGSIWIGTDGSGIYRLRPDRCTHFGKEAGLLSDSIRTLYLATDGGLWIGTAGGGLSCLKGEQIKTLIRREGLPENTISQILEDNAGRLWLGGSRGIACVSARRLDDFDHGRITNLNPQAYGGVDGMSATECAGGFFPAGLRTKSGWLWFSTMNGVAVADPRNHATNVPPPSVVLEEVLVDGVPRSEGVALARANAPPTPGPAPAGILRVQPGRHRFELQYTGLSFDALDQLCFRYQLEGLDAGWVEAGSRRTAFYNYVPPGHYRFRVSASNGDGVWNETVTTLRLIVAPYFWQKPWIIGLSCLGLLVSVGGAARLVGQRKLHRQMRQLEQERALAGERTRIARDLHDEMGAKLCRISFLSEHARRTAGTPPDVQEQIDSISEASREVLHSLDEIVWAVNPENDSLEHLVSYLGQYAQDYFQMTGIECELDIAPQFPPHRLSAQVRHHLFLAAHEAFTNILKHAGATRARVAMTCGSAGFLCTACDNGHGFDPAAPGSHAAETTHCGNGLRNMRQRLEAIGGRCEVHAAVGKGTAIHFILPLNFVPNEI